MNLASFIAAHNGQYAHDPGGLGGQCTDICNLWLASHGLPAVRANAIDWQHATIPGWRWEPNGPNNFPPPGALVVWGTYPGLTGVYGHIAVVVTADGESLVSMDQNWGGQVCRLVVHSYAGVLGWWQPA